MIKGRGIRWAVGGVAVAVGLCVGAFLACGCGRDVRLSGKELREIEVKPVSHFGLTLDQDATPEKVAFAAMQAIKADAAAKNDAEREAALDAQFDLAAANELAARNRTALDAEEFYYSVVHHWTPTVSYYVGDFPGTLEEAAQRLQRRSMSKTEAELAMVVKPPGEDPAARIVMLIWLANDKGMWRVLHFGFENGTRTVGRASEAAADTAEQATP